MRSESSNTSGGSVECGDPRRRAPAAEIAAGDLAAVQHGVVARSQLIGAGMSVATVDRWVRRGRLRKLHGGIYLLGPVAGPRAREMAAALACGKGAVVSHRSAAAIWELSAPRPPSDPVDVTVTLRDRRRAGVRVHRVRCLPADDVTVEQGLPVTSAPRTLLDLAGIADLRETERALERYTTLRLGTPAALQSLARRRPTRRGATRLLALLDDGPPPLTRSEAEERFLQLVRRGQLPAPATNVRVAGCEVDFLWRKQRFVVEVDGHAFHASRRAFESDRRRDALLAAAGFQVVRVTWRQLREEPEALLVRLARTLLQADLRGT
jgi:very-short-patch-repair endonuclease